MSLNIPKFLSRVLVALSLLSLIDPTPSYAANHKSKKTIAKKGRKTSETSQKNDTETKSVRAKDPNDPLDLSSPFAILIDAITGTVLYERQPDTKMTPSSMSKIMTAYMVFEKLKKGEWTLDTTLPVSENAWRKQGSKMFVDLNSNIRVEDLLRGIVVQSGNDACIVVAEAASGTEEAFARLMTKRAQEIGAKNTTLLNATGWPDEGHTTTPRDLALMAQRTITDFPEYYGYYKEIDFTYNSIKQGNRNPLLYKNFGADGLKTGHTDEGGYGLVASAIQNGRRLIMVINGAPGMKERAHDAEVLMGYGFREYENVVVAEKDQVIEIIPVWLGQAPTVGAYVSGGANVTVARADKEKVKIDMIFDTPVSTPIQKDQKLGEIKVTMPAGDVKTFDLLAHEDVAELGFFAKMWTRVKSFF